MLFTGTMAVDQILGHEFYARPSLTVARELLGKKIVRRWKGDEIRGVIKEVAAWHGETESKHPGLRYAPGEIGISKRFGQQVMLISTDRTDIASCVTLIAAELLDGGKPVLYQGPGKIAKALHIDEGFDRVKVYDNGMLSIVESGIPEQEVLKRSSKNIPANCKGYFYIQ
jgi:3-methyladenine DNA glycosylase Mpg